MLNETQVFLNIVLDDAVEEKAGGEKVRLGMVVGFLPRFHEKDAAKSIAEFGVITGHPGKFGRYA